MLQRKQAVLWRELDGEAVLLSPTAGCSYSLNQVGTFIWKLLDGQHTPGDIATALCEDYEVEYEQAIQDVEHILADLQSNDLLQEYPQSRSIAQDNATTHSTRSH
ncbi:MAG: PqqD family protein [Ktedonobacteraceae bacterium]